MDEFDTEDEALFGASDNLIEEETDTNLLEELDIYGCVSSLALLSFHILFFFLFHNFEI